MNILFLLLYGFTTLFIVLYKLLRQRGGYYEFPFWVGVIALGWFFPQAIAGYKVADQFPEGMYAASMLFATLCNLAMWAGFEWAKNRPVNEGSWLNAEFRLTALFWVGALMCMVGWFFQWKLMNLPAEMLAKTRWSGAAVKYLFFASVFQMGFVILWLVFISRGRWRDPKLLVFIVPCLILVLNSIVFSGRRAEMMNLFSYLFVSLWFVRRISMPRPVLIGALCFGMVLINGIGIYRGIMKDDDLSVKVRLERAFRADYFKESKANMQGAGSEFKNYVYMISLYSTYGGLDYGGYHWNELVFNYVPSQIVGRAFKDSLRVEHGVSAREAKDILAEKFSYDKGIGTTISGYSDSFGSFGWFGWVKFLLIGFIMGGLYKYAMRGGFMPQLMYVYVLGSAMHIVTHDTNRILTSIWVYFFVLCYPLLFLARVRKAGG